ncbi:hypothetical protein [Nocardiopsis halotolerans]|uniref:hypothetical protein n=1 Tax=Nocardiopsis halotolerans TaxID=124252 RepID=UPI000345B460|nr:hypothetical protein [Nocardiopsis halotolerans]
MNAENLILEGPGIDTLVRDLNAILTDPGHPAHAAVRVRRADRLFSGIDRHLREGGALPVEWRVDADVSGSEDATAAYDMVSEELRSRGDVIASWRVLGEAAYWWDALTSMLTTGGPLPEPWDGRRGGSAPSPGSA